MTNEEKKKPITVQEAGRRGGKATSKKYGSEFYEAIGSLGGRTTKARHGPEFYEKIGKKGGHRVRELIEKGKNGET